MIVIINGLRPLIPWFAAIVALVIIGLFLAFRSDYKGHPDRTRIAVKLTLSTIAHVLTLGRAKKELPPDRRHASHQRRHAEDLGTISAPIKAVPPLHRPSPKPISKPIPRAHQPHKNHLTDHGNHSKHEDSDS